MSQINEWNLPVNRSYVSSAKKGCHYEENLDLFKENTHRNGCSKTNPAFSPLHCNLLSQSYHETTRSWPAITAFHCIKKSKVLSSSTQDFTHDCVNFKRQALPGEDFRACLEAPARKLQLVFSGSLPSKTGTSLDHNPSCAFKRTCFFRM